MANIDPTLGQLRLIQASFDEDNFSGASTPEGKRRHVYFHLSGLVAKFAQLELAVDLGDDKASLLETDIVPDLLVFAAMLAETEDLDLGAVYKRRLEFIAGRNGTGSESAHSAIKTGTQKYDQVSGVE